MKKINMKQIMPLILAAVALVFIYIGITQLGFWHSVDGPQPGFFPSIMGVVMFLTSMLAFMQSFKGDGADKPKYSKDEFLLIASVAGIIAATFVIGLLPSCFVFVLVWLKVVEKSSWKSTLIVLAVIAVIVVGVFQVWLDIQFPMGVFEALL